MVDFKRDQAIPHTQSRQTQAPRAVPRVLRFAPPSVLTPDELTRLQRSVGNQAVEQLLDQRLDALVHNKPINPTAPVTVTVHEITPTVTGQRAPQGTTADPYAKTPGSVGVPSTTGPGAMSLGQRAPWSSGNRPTGPRKPSKIGQRGPAPSSPAKGPSTSPWLRGAPSGEQARLKVLGARQPNNGYSKTPGSGGSDGQNAPVVGPRSDNYSKTPGTSSAPPPTAPTAHEPIQPQPLVLAPPSRGGPTARPLKTEQGYLKLKSRREQYQDEFTSVNFSLLGVLRKLREQLEKGQLPPNITSVEDALMQGYGWTKNDCKKYRKYLNLKTPDRPLKANQIPVVKSVGPEERRHYELHLGSTITRGTSKNPYDTSKERSQFLGDGYAIYVMDRQGTFYAGNQKVGLFHHSSLVGGAAVAGAGELKIEKGKLTFISNESGHYQPDPEHFIQVLNELRSHHIDLSKVELKLLTKWDDPQRLNAEQFWNDYWSRPAT
jgi:hypothetical protein